MSQVKIFTTPSSITIYDGQNNRLIVRRTETGILFEGTTATKRVNNSIIKLQTAIKAFISQRSKDNYKVRFAKLANHLSGIETHSFVTLSNKLQTQGELEPA